MSIQVQPQTRRAIRRRLLVWWADHRRDLPWRNRRNPYRVWVAEMMLQQTQVATVGPYYTRWLRRFPSFRALASAELDDVLKCWEGLGYYSRARHMLAAAKIVVTRFGGRLPKAPDELRALPGIGRYTAGAIASIAFGADEPVLDGNVIRVLCRLLAVRQDPRATLTRQDLWRLAGELIPVGRAGSFNEALMDLGATICLPRSPRCSACPLRPLCLARRDGLQNRLPVRPNRKRPPSYDVVVGLVIKRGRILIDRRRPEGLLGGLWEFPGGKIECGETAAQAVRREILEEVGVEVVPQDEPLVTVQHAYSHFRIALRAVICRPLRGRARPLRCAAVKWVPLDRLDQYAFPQANRKVLTALRDRFGPTEGSAGDRSDVAK